MTFCPSCGKGIEVGSAFCPHCGKRIALPAIDPSNESIIEEEFKIFIGKNADYYLYKFRNFSVRGANSFAVTWNWSAFFLGFIWMLYRKMYLWALIAFFIAFTPVALPLTMIGWGIVGNYLYYLHARKKILEYKSRQSQISIRPVPVRLRRSQSLGLVRRVHFLLVSSDNRGFGIPSFPPFNGILRVY